MVCSRIAELQSTLAAGVIALEIGSRNGKYDDQVDQLTQVLNRLRGAVAPPKKPVYRPPPQPSGERSWMR